MIITIVIFCVFLLSLFLLVIIILFHKIEMNLLFNFKLDDHPWIEYKLKKLLFNLAKENNVEIFNLEDDVLNKDLNKKNKSLGKYVYIPKSIDSKINEILENNRKIVELIKSSPIKIKEKYDLMNYAYPQIRLLTMEDRKKTIKFEDYKISYYSTLAHELGHHFAIVNENDNSEKRADEIGYQLIRENLPDYFSLIGNLGNVTLSKCNMMKILLYYFNYRLKKKRLERKIS